MKAKKILSLVLALCMVLSVLSAGFVVANAAETGELYDEIAANAEPDADTYAGAKTDADENNNENTDEEIGESSTVWGATADSVSTLSEDEAVKYLSVIVSHYADAADFAFLPLQVIATQDVSGGTLKSVLTWTSKSKEQMEIDTIGYTQEQKDLYKAYGSWYTVFTFFEDAKGNLTFIKAVIITPSDIKTLDKNTQNANAPWVIKEQKGSSKFDFIDQPIKNYPDIALNPIACIGVELNEIFFPLTYKYLCYGTVNGKTNLYVVSLKYKEGSTTELEVTDVSYFDINQYTSTDTSNVPKDTTEDTTKSSTTDKDDSDDNVKKDTSSKSPQTGSNDIASAFAILFFVSCLAGVSAYKFSKKRG